jgi:hypothetical protein
MRARPAQTDSARAAHHEAGHCVAAEATGVPVKRATIEPAGGGRVLIRKGIVGDIRTVAEFKRAVEDKVVVLLSGPVAECFYVCDDVDELHKYGSTDLARAAEWHERQGLDLPRLRRRAADLVERRWDEVARVARALTARGTLTGSEIQKAMSGGDLAKRATLSKPSVGYTDTSPMRTERCATCSMFRPPDKCTLVRGDVSPRGWCREALSREPKCAQRFFKF